MTHALPLLGLKSGLLIANQMFSYLSKLLPTVFLQFNGNFHAAKIKNTTTELLKLSIANNFLPLFRGSRMQVRRRDTLF